MSASILFEPMVEGDYDHRRIVARRTGAGRVPIQATRTGSDSELAVFERSEVEYLFVSVGVFGLFIVWAHQILDKSCV